MQSEAPTRPTLLDAFVGRDGRLTSPAALVLDSMWRNTAPGFPIVPCQAVTTGNVIALTPILTDEGGVNVDDHMAFAFVADASISGAGTVTIGQAGTYKLYVNDGATQATTGDVVSGRLYLGVFNQALDTGAGGLVLIGGKTTAGIPGISAFMQTLLDDTSAGAGRATLAIAESVGICGVCINAKLVASRSGNAETLALKTLAGSDPSATDPVTWIGCNGTIALVTSAVSLTISSGSTLGATSGTAFNLHFALVNDSGTFRIAVLNATNANGWTRFSPAGVLSATSEGGAGGADTIKTVYSSAAITSKEYAHLGFISYSLATAGTWNTAPLASGFGPTAPKPGDELQAVYSTDSGTVNVTSGTFVVMANKNVAITPRLAANLIYVHGTIMSTRNGPGELAYGMWHRGTTNNTNAFGSQEWGQSDGTPNAVRDSYQPFGFDKPNTTSSQTYTLQGRRQFGSSTDYNTFYGIAREIMA